MTLEIEEGPGVESGAFPKVDRRGRQTHGSSLTQNERVVELLKDHDTVCGTTFLKERMPRYGGRIFELRQSGFVIERERCEDPNHGHVTTQWCWRLIAIPEGRLWFRP